ncbi:GntR family transcriptional regulator [Micromonospora chalcea]|uniref:GntR family transcriptional regulator n=1 Tax=Micromonospora chalcea TaxID=1874 RepID=UPI0033E5752A
MLSETPLPSSFARQSRTIGVSSRPSSTPLGKTSARYGEQVPTPHYGQPRYRVIADELRERIESGAIPPGALLPAESVLTAEFGASRGTVRQAIAVLREERLVATERGRGTYTSPLRPESGLQQGSQPQLREREVPADRELAALFAVEVGATLVEQESVTRTEGVVRTVVRSYQLPPASTRQA